MTESPPGSRPRILLVDDVMQDRALGVRILTRLGYEVATAASAEAGITRLAGEPFDLVLMDLFMPGLDGAEATRRIRALDGQAASVPVIGLSGSVLPSDRRHCIESGMTDFLSKPFAPAEIAPRLLNWIDGRTA